MFKLTKKLFLLLAVLMLGVSVSYSQNDNMNADHSDQKQMKSSEPTGTQLVDGMLYGKDYDPTMVAVDYAEFIIAPENYNGKTVLIKGSVAEVCQAMGCWMTMSDGKNVTRVKTNHEFLLPKDIAGSNAVVIGVFKITEISEEDAKHYNEESKNPTVKTEDIKGPQTAYEIDAIGIKILNPAESPAKN